MMELWQGQSWGKIRPTCYCRWSPFPLPSPPLSSLSARHEAQAEECHYHKYPDHEWQTIPASLCPLLSHVSHSTKISLARLISSHSASSVSLLKKNLKRPELLMTFVAAETFPLRWSKTLISFVMKPSVLISPNEITHCLYLLFTLPYRISQYKVNV